MVLCLGHTSAAKELKAGEGMKVLMNGKVVSVYTRNTEDSTAICTTRIIWQGRFYICKDYVVFDPKHRLDVGTGQVVARCFDDEKVSD